MYYTVHLQYLVFEHDKIRLTKRSSRYFSIYPVAGLESGFNRNILCICNECIQRFFLLPVLFWGLGRCTSCRSSCLGSGCSGGNTDSPNPKKISNFFNLSFSKIWIILLNKYFNFDLQHSQVSETANF
jgi:hypothetical protein